MVIINLNSFPFLQKMFVNAYSAGLAAVEHNIADS
jgi:hypothetical protein